MQVSKVKLQKESLVQVEEVKWRPKTRVKNKLRLNMKKILNPKLRNEKVMMIEDSSDEEDMGSEEELNSQQVYIKEEHLVLLKSFLGKDKISEDPITFSIERGVSLEVPVVQETVKDREEDDIIFKKIDIPWLSDRTSTLQGGMYMDSEIKNLKKTMKQYKY